MGVLEFYGSGRMHRVSRNTAPAKKIAAAARAAFVAAPAAPAATITAVAFK